MRLTLDTDEQLLVLEEGSSRRAIDLYSPESFTILSREWLRVGWSLKYSYQFSWLGRPVVQLPEDLMRIQEVVYQISPDIIVETGIAHGGSLIFYASLFHAMGKGRVIGVDVEIREHNRAAIEAHPLAGYITLIEGSSTDPSVFDAVRGAIGGADSVMVILDSDHSYAHVSAELRLYAALVTPGSYLVAQDGIMRDLRDVPGGQMSWRTDNPAAAVQNFRVDHPEFEAGPPPAIFSESSVAEPVTYWPTGWLKKRQ